MQEILGFVTVAGAILFICRLTKAADKAYKNLPQSTMDVSTGGYCLQVYDGDTIKCRLGGREVVIRLYGIVSPKETHNGKSAQGFAGEATGYLAGRILNAWVTVIPVEDGPYMMTIARVYAGDEDMSLSLIKLGLAETYRKNLAEPYLIQYSTAENEAKINRLGLWSWHGHPCQE